MFGFAQPLSGVRATHFGLLTHLRLAEHGEQHDASAGCEPVGNALVSITKAETQLAELAAEVAGVRFVERGGLLGEEVGEAFGLLVVMGGNIFQPQPHLRLDLDRVPPTDHNTDDIRHGGESATSQLRRVSISWFHRDLFYTAWRLWALWSRASLMTRANSSGGIPLAALCLSSSSERGDPPYAAGDYILPTPSAQDNASAYLTY